MGVGDVVERGVGFVEWCGWGGVGGAWLRNL
jgi:hypothetical protein